MHSEHRQTTLRDLERPERYDDLLRCCLPNYAVFFGTAAEYLPAGEVDILELGSGTGWLTRTLRQANPGAAITAIDRNPAMIALARQKPGLDAVTFVEADIRAPWPAEAFDIIAATQVLFALAIPEQEEILRRSAAALRAGGRLIVGDAFLPETAWEEGIYRAHWREYMVESGVAREEADAMIASRDDILHQVPTLAVFKDMLRDAGFSRVLIPYWYELYAVVVAFV
ncbi:MAG TPA: class I SAM-dependent methyltransferase [Methanoculleus sp.]|nr:class I SAM-dependent methyltransferase [Methanoculleus sp.]